ncbi:hypothetical protein F5878DRAFT_614936 [Lentinula raphanica]|uniref:Uncharacterized protein n=1 Tax=Lentinula raphanica TaxID=153919 RepID=A0AA38PBK8_9AGAR|nr:hypothetical protein F5878DRAFT_614936 [Lentinula raphanica]
MRRLRSRLASLHSKHQKTYGFRWVHRYKPPRLRPLPPRAGLLPLLSTTTDQKLCALKSRYAQQSEKMVYTRSMITTLLALGAVSSVVVVSAVPIDTNSGPSLVPTSTTMTSGHTPTSTSVSSAAASSAILDDPINSDNVLPGVAQSLDRVPLPKRHQRRRAPPAGAGKDSGSAPTNEHTNGQTNGQTNGNHAQTNGQSGSSGSRDAFLANPDPHGTDGYVLVSPGGEVLRSDLRPGGAHHPSS